MTTAKNNKEFSEYSDIFIDSILQDKIKVPSKYISKNKNDYILKNLKNLENKCTKHGYIKENSIELIDLSLGLIEHATLQGSVLYTVKYKALVCNPIIGSIIVAKIDNTNQFGLLCNVKSGVNSVIDIIVPKKLISVVSEIDLDKLKIGDTVSIRLLGKKFHINDKKISGIGTIVSTTANALIKLEEEPNDNDDEFVVEEDELDISDIESEVDSDNGDVNQEGGVEEEDIVPKVKALQKEVVADSDDSDSDIDIDSDSDIEGVDDDIEDTDDIDDGDD